MLFRVIAIYILIYSLWFSDKKKLEKKKNNKKNYTIKTEEKSKRIKVIKKYNSKIFCLRTQHGRNHYFLSKLGQRLRPLN